LKEKRDLADTSIETYVKSFASIRMIQSKEKEEQTPWTQENSLNSDSVTSLTGKPDTQQV